jgi:hypothetical protein
MKTSFYGSSDDLVEIEGDVPMLNGMDKGRGTAEFDVCGRVDQPGPIPFHIVGAVEKCGECGHPKEPVHLATVYVIYDGAWHFSFGPVMDGPAIPSHWQVDIKQKHEYSALLTIYTGGDDVSILAPWHKSDEEE